MTFLVGLVHSGDSIAGGNVGPAGPSYFFQAFSFTGYGDSGSAATQSFPTYYGTNLIARNYAVSGTRLNTNGYPDFVPLAAQNIDPLVPVGYGAPPNDKFRRYILTNAIGSNDGAIGSFGTGNFAQYAAAVASAVAARKNAGFKAVAMCTLLPRTDGVMTEPNRTGYNSTITGAGFAATNNIDAIIDLASETTMGNPTNCSNSTYYCQNGVNGYSGISGLHPTATGHGLLAPIYLTAVNAMIAALT